jgi:hypothetical protein
MLRCWTRDLIFPKYLTLRYLKFLPHVTQTKLIAYLRSCSLFLYLAPYLSILIAAWLSFIGAVIHAVACWSLENEISPRLSPYPEIVHLLLCLTAPLRVLLLIRHCVGALPASALQTWEESSCLYSSYHGRKLEMFKVDSYLPLLDLHGIMKARKPALSSWLIASFLLKFTQPAILVPIHWILSVCTIISTSSLILPAGFSIPI